MSATLFKHIYRKIKLASIICLLSFHYGCIKEALESCEQEAILLVKIVDADTRADITDSESVDMVDLFVFDTDGYFLEHLSVSSDHIKHGRPVSVKSRGAKGLLISAWGNLNNEQTVSEATRGCEINNLSVLLKTTGEGYASCPSNLFFGLKQIDYEPNKKILSYQEIPVSQKNARMFITVRGLPANADESDYYFTICGVRQGYDFKGNPLDNSFDIKQTGTFRTDNHDFVTPDIFNLIHTSITSNHLVINLHKKEPVKAGSMVISVTEDGTGKPIIPLEGKTTNVLIDLRSDASIKIVIEITPWDQVFHWEEW